RSFNSATAHRRGEPWRDWERATTEARLQFGHGSPPWRTELVAIGRRRGSALQFGHGSPPWRTLLGLTAVPTDEGILQLDHAPPPWRTTRMDPSVGSRGTTFNSATAHRRGDPRRGRSKTRPRHSFNSATAHRRGEPGLAVHWWG